MAGLNQFYKSKTPLSSMMGSCVHSTPLSSMMGSCVHNTPLSSMMGSCVHNTPLSSMMGSCVHSTPLSSMMGSCVHNMRFTYRSKTILVWRLKRVRGEHAPCAVDPFEVVGVTSCFVGDRIVQYVFLFHFFFSYCFSDDILSVQNVILWC